MNASTTTTYVPFTPSSTSTPPFQVNVTLDGQSYSLTTAWNFYGARWYYALTSQNGVVLVNAPLIGSPPATNIYLAPGFFTSTTLVYRVSTNQFEIAVTA